MTVNPAPKGKKGNPPSPPNANSLAARLRNIGKIHLLPDNRLRRHLGVLVVTEMLGRVQVDDQPLFLIKGGSSIELRLGIVATRSSSDLDAVFRGSFDRMYDLAREALQAGWNGFTAVVTPAETIDVPGLPVKPKRFNVKLKYKGSDWNTIPVEVSPPEAGAADWPEFVEPSPFTELHLGTIGLDEVASVPCMPLAWQLAQKFHACTAVPVNGRKNDRAHDLIDILLLWPLLPQEDHLKVYEASREIFRIRSAQTWPPSVTDWPDWPKIYEQETERMLDASAIPATSAEAVRLVQEIIDLLDELGSPEEQPPTEISPNDASGVNPSSAD